MTRRNSSFVKSKIALFVLFLNDQIHRQRLRAIIMCITVSLTLPDVVLLNFPCFVLIYIAILRRVQIVFTQQHVSVSGFLRHLGVVVLGGIKVLTDSHSTWVRWVIV